MGSTLPRMLMALALAGTPAWSAEPGQPAAGADTAEAQKPIRKSAAYKAMPTLLWPGMVDREALVYLRVTISEAGMPTDIAVDPDHGFHEKRFVDAAIKGMKSARFQPATMDGKAVATTMIAPVTFKLGGPNADQSQWAIGITDAFRAELLKVEKLLKARDYAGAHHHAEWMLSEKVKFAYEFAVLNAELAQTLALVGREHEALQAAMDATQRTTTTYQQFDPGQPVPPNKFSNYLLPEEAITALLKLRMRLAGNNGLFVEALMAYQELAGLLKLAPDDPMAVAAAEMTSILRSDKPLVARALLDDKGWWQPLYRPSFTLQKVKGNVDSLALLCSQEQRDLPYAPAEEWTIPAGWEWCSVHVRGDAGTSFELVEFTK